MRIRTKIAIAFLILCATAVTTITIIHSQQKSSSISLKQRTIQQDDVPIANYDEPLPNDLQEKTKRQKRNKRANLKLGPDTGVFDPKRFALTEKRNSSFGGFDTHAPAEPAIPAAQSDVIVLGKITKAEAFLSEDKVTVYSEFSVNVEKVFKNATSEQINLGDSISISRGGGAVRFPSGKIIRILFDGKPMPHVESHYVLFLKYDSERDDFPLITAYEIQDNKIVPLDGLQRDGQVVRQLASHQSYSGMAETDFLSLVQQAVSDSEDLFENKGAQ